MSRQLRIACIVVIIALAAAWGLARHNNAELAKAVPAKAES